MDFEPSLKPAIEGIFSRLANVIDAQSAEHSLDTLLLIMSELFTRRVRELESTLAQQEAAIRQSQVRFAEVEEELRRLKEQIVILQEEKGNREDVEYLFKRFEKLKLQIAHIINSSK